MIPYFLEKRKLHPAGTRLAAWKTPELFFTQNP
jgi:hypothetical protein